VHKSRLRRRRYVYCSSECYLAFLKAGSGGHAQRLAKPIVSRYFDIPKGAVIHHEDGDYYNNSITNLKVFRSQADHVKYHRCGDVEPIWDGGQVTNY